jgi:cysteine desulfurase
MANVGSSSLRQAARLCAKNISSAGLIRSSVLPRAAVVAASGQKVSGRRYVSESKKDAAQVNVESAVKADQKKFVQEMGKTQLEQPMQPTGANADAMMDPMAGMNLLSPRDVRLFLLTTYRCLETGYHHGRRTEAHLSRYASHDSS